MCVLCARVCARACVRARVRARACCVGGLRVLRGVRRRLHLPPLGQPAAQPRAIGETTAVEMVSMVSILIGWMRSLECRQQAQAGHGGRGRVRLGVGGEHGHGEQEVVER